MGGDTPNYPASPHLRFIEAPSGGRITKIWDVKRADSTFLGEVRWLATWRRYSFFPDGHTAYDASCLHAIADFCHTQTFERKRERKMERTDHGVRGKDYGA